MKNIKIEIKYDSMNIYIHNILHLRIARSKLLGVQSWIQESRKMYFIEYTMESNNIICEYDDIEKWKEILKQLDKVL